VNRQENGMSDLSGQVAVVTGGASGIGRATAIALAKARATVFIGDRTLRAENDGLFTELGIRQQPCDVTVEADVARLIDAAATAGPLRILVNNAGIGMVKPITEVTEAEWDACLDTNLKGAFLGCKHAIRRMQPKEGGQGGSIVNIASNAGLLPRAHDPVYSISKAALVALTKSLALCHAPDRIRVNAVCPGPVGETRMMNDDLDRATDPQALAQNDDPGQPAGAGTRPDDHPRGGRRGRAVSGERRRVPGHRHGRRHRRRQVAGGSTGVSASWGHERKMTMCICVQYTHPLALGGDMARV
jgi:3-oxoacyl-[acyl-carrier protein] reductase